MGDIPVGSHEHHAPPAPVDPAHVEDVAFALVIVAEDLLVVLYPPSHLICAGFFESGVQKVVWLTQWLSRLTFSPKPKA